MPLYCPTELFSFLEGIDAAPKKGLSQNFLIDGNILRKIVAAADVQEGDAILEIGAGPGALTEALLEKKAAVVAVEKDTKFAAALSRFPALKVFSGDILEFPLDSLPREKLFKVVANLPYHLTTPILALLMPRSDLFSSITVMVQDEVGRRMTAKAATSDYGALSVFLQFYSTPRYCFKVSPRCFYPAPKVSSAVVQLHLKEPPQVDATTFFKLVRTAFCHRRKMLRASLRSLYAKETIEEALQTLSLPQEARPEELSLENFVQLTRFFQKI